MNEHKGDQYEIQDKHKWIGQEVGINTGIPLVDEGKGKPYIIRQFEFSFSPKFIKDLKDGKTKLERQALFNSHWRQIQITLWGDGLVASQEVEPRMVIGKKRYKIFLLCEPRLGTMVAERPKTLQDLIKPTA